MEKITPYVLSSRRLNKTSSLLTYLVHHEGRASERDTANPYFNFGRYTITRDEDGFKTDYPEFFTNDEFDEKLHFIEYMGGNYSPGPQTEALFNEVFSSIQKSDKLLYIYLHGFGNNAEREMKKQVLPMCECYYPHGKNPHSPVGEIIFLTWPSQGFLQYKTGEKKDVSKMAAAVAVFFLKLYNYVRNKQNPLFKDGWKPKIVFHSQSMGCKILLTAVQRLNDLTNANMIKKNSLDKFFHRIVMTGADIDLDAMNDMEDENGEEIHQLSERVILFYNHKDRALWISRFVFSSGRRLGRHLDDETLEHLPKNIDLVEMNGIKGDPIGHNYFTTNANVAQFLRDTLRDGLENNIAVETGRRFNLNTQSGVADKHDIHLS